MEKTIVVRFAPSPTGYLHIGGARTAIFNWLFARKTGGKFILRIEDTDAERSTEASIQAIIEGLRWLGLDWDEGPYFQSRFVEDHIKAAENLLKTGHAYKCFCTKDELEKKRENARKQKLSLMYDGACRRLSPEEISEKEAAGSPYTIRLRVPRDGDGVVFRDRVYGFIRKNYADLEDFVIVRSNGKPLYVLSNAVDDIRDGITHVIRGQDHLANTPKQILIYNALGTPVPEFAHMSLTLDPEKAKISKRRHGERVAVQFYQANGFLPWALINFLVLLGWATTDSREIFSKQELIEAFSLDGISKTNSVMNIRQDDPKFFTDPKAISINAHYLKTAPIEDIARLVRDRLESAGLWDTTYENEKRSWFLNTVDLIRKRYHLTTDFITLGRAFFSDHFETVPQTIEKHILKNDSLKHWLPVLADRITALKPYTAETIERTIRVLLKESGIKTGILISGVRVAVTGQDVGPEFIETLLAVGQQAVADRLKGVARFFTQKVTS